MFVQVIFKRSIFFNKKLFVKLNHSWTLPEGNKTPIKIYNCITRKKEPLVVSNKNAVTWYTCGPTVYDSSHIGHASCYVKLDIIQRILKEQFRLNLVTCMNITDIDDKIIKKAVDTKTDYKEVAKRYEEEFWVDLNSLSVLRPDIVVRVTENIDIIIEFIKKLFEDGFAYKGKDNSVYFEVLKACKQYGKLQNIGESLPDGKNPNKKAPEDFALWKALKNIEEPHFDSPWGPGRPGWHIECSTLASHIFGSNIDIHAGGLDLRFPHHENEEAQSCAYHATNQWVNYWMHTGYLHLKNDVKMSKSLKNTISIQEMLKHTKSDVFRLLCTMSHYRSPVEFSEDLLCTAESYLKVYKNFLTSCKEIQEGFLRPSLNTDILNKTIKTLVTDITEGYCDDFNIPLVIQKLNSVISETNSMIYTSATSNSNKGLYNVLAIRNILCNTLNLFGIDLQHSKSNVEGDSTKFIELLVNFRQNVRSVGLKEKNNDLLSICDDARTNLIKSGVTIKDHGMVTSWSR